jgi:cytochrome c biogenesis protein CcdA
MKTETVRKYLVLFIVLAALAGFAVMVSRAMYLTLAETTIPEFSDTYTYVASILAGLVGGIVAVGFGQSPLEHGPGGPNVLARNAAGLAAFLSGEQPHSLLAGSPTVQNETRRDPGNRSGLSEAAGLAYAVVYVVLGIIAVVVWVAKEDLTPNLVKNLASVSLGLLIPIVVTFFRETPT